MIWKLVFIVRLTFQSFLNDGSILVILYLSGLVLFLEQVVTTFFKLLSFFICYIALLSSNQRLIIVHESYVITSSFWR